MADGQAGWGTAAVAHGKAVCCCNICNICHRRVPFRHVANKAFCEAQARVSKDRQGMALKAKGLKA